MKTTPDYEQDYNGIGAVRFYNEGGKWRYIHASGEGVGLSSLEACQQEIETFLNVPKFTTRKDDLGRWLVVKDGQVDKLNFFATQNEALEFIDAEQMRGE